MLHGGLILMVEQVPHAQSLGIQIAFVVFVAPVFQRASFHDFNAVVGQGVDFGRIVGHEYDLDNSQGFHDFRTDAVMPGVGWKAQLKIGIHGVQAVILQIVGFDFVEKADAAAFLAHIQQYAASFLCNGGHGCGQLEAAVAAQATQNVPGEAFGMNAAEYWLTVVNAARIEHGMIQFMLIPEDGDIEEPVFGRKFGVWPSLQHINLLEPAAVLCGCN